MLFHTWTFAAFFGVAWLGYWVLHRNARTRLFWLSAASWTFYGCWDWRFLGLLGLSTIVDYLCARGIGASEDRARRRWLMGISLVVNLGVLGLFKYLDFFASSTVALLQLFGLQASWVTLGIVLPAGISFYTLQTLGYTIDVYRGKQQPVRDPLLFAAFVAFFPQLVAGPIERAGRLMPQLERTPTFRFDDQLEGALRFLTGLWKKLIVADQLGLYADSVFATPAGELNGYQMLFGTLAFAGQIWGDFSAYSDMAIGAARTLGVRLIENFDAPYFAHGPRDLWRRWHISLSTWLRDYLYIPLGGDRLGPLRTHVNLLATMLIGGLWHGAKWTFVFWGLFLGLWLVIDRALGNSARRRTMGPLRRGLGIGLTFLLICISLILLRAPDIGTAWWFIVGIAQPGSWPALEGALRYSVWVDARYLLAAGWPVFVLQAARRWLPGAHPDDPGGLPYRLAVAGFGVFSLLTVPILVRDAPYYYFQF